MLCVEIPVLGPAGLGPAGCGDTVTPLCEIALKYDTDKVRGSRGGTGHDYTPFYHHLFADRSVQRVLEIGICSNDICTGPSLRMWADYFPNAQVVGLDICDWVILNEGRISSSLVDCGDEGSLRRFVDSQRGVKYDIIVDDGSHDVDHQILSAKMLLSLLADGGTYIIEDVVSPEAAYKIWRDVPRPSRVIEFRVDAKEDDRIVVFG